MRKADLERRRCLLLQLAAVFGILLAAFTRTWVSIVVGLGGSALALVTYWRECRRADEDS
jgi:hypothetical protein